MEYHFDISADAEATQADAKHVTHGVGEYAASIIGEAHFTPLRIFARSESGELVGGLVGGMYWQWLHIESLWVHEAHRRQGIGSGLVVRAESEAVRCGCLSAYLDTYSFLAKPFYEHMGYSVAGSIEDFPAGHTRFFMCKRTLDGGLR